MTENSKSPIYSEVVAANEAYTEAFGDKGKLALPPARAFAILTCMDALEAPAGWRRRDSLEQAMLPLPS